MGGFSLTHWIILLVVVVLIFGTKKLRNAGRDIGGAVHDFKKGMNEGNAEIDAAKKAKEADAIEHEKKDV